MQRIAHTAREYPDTFYRKKAKKTSQSLFMPVSPMRHCQAFMQHSSSFSL
jgi:hypothetical protein